MNEPKKDPTLNGFVVGLHTLGAKAIERMNAVGDPIAKRKATVEAELRKRPETAFLLNARNIRW